MNRDRYDIVVIGAGPAGQSAAELAAFLGRSALIVEQASPGGVVTTTGGAPTKTLREVALSLTAERREDAIELVRARTVEVCRTLQRGIARQIEARGIAYLHGTARLASGRRVIVELPDGSRREIAAGAIVLATGSRPMRFDGVPFDDPDVYDSNEIFTMSRLPKTIVVTGAGPAGIEFATILGALGVSVTIVDRGARLLPNMDGELSDRLRAEFERRGTTLLLGAGVDSVSRRNGQLTVDLSSGTSLQPDAVLFAAGRKANIEGLGLDEAGIGTDARGRIVVDRYFQTTCDGVYAVGDVVGQTLASIAAQHGRTAVTHALGLSFGVPVDRAPSAAVYGMPELASVGATEEQVRASDTLYVVGRCDLAETTRGAIAGQGGQLKLIVRADDRKLLGVHCIGEIASELVGMGQAVLHMSGAVDVFLALALNTPTYSAAYRDAAIDALGQLAKLAHRTVRAVPEPALALHTIGDRS